MVASYIFRFHNLHLGSELASVLIPGEFNLRFVKNYSLTEIVELSVAGSCYGSFPP